MLGFLLALQTASPPAPVGFRVDLAIDSVRRYTGAGSTRPRQLGVYLWYPARPGSGSPMRFGDYLAPPAEPALRGTAAGAAYWRQSLEQALDTSFAESDLQAVRRSGVRARLEARPADGRHPLILLLPGLNSPAWLFVDLAEALAAAGYVVAAIPSFGPADSIRLGFDTLAVASQLADLRLALARTAGLAQVDSTRVALGAWSTGGVSTLLHAAREGGVAALLSLDAAAGYRYGVDLLGEMGFRPGQVHAPLLHFSAGVTGQRPVPRSSAVFVSMGEGLVWQLDVARFRHADFTAIYGSRFPGGGVAPDQVTAAALAFLDAFVRGRGDDWRRLQDQGIARSLRR